MPACRSIDWPFNLTLHGVEAETIAATENHVFARGILDLQKGSLNGR